MHFTGLGEEVLNLGGPLHSDEASSHHQHSRLLVVQGLDGIVLLQDVSTSAFQEPLIDVGPTASNSGLFL